MCVCVYQKERDHRLPTKDIMYMCVCVWVCTHTQRDHRLPSDTHTHTHRGTIACQVRLLPLTYALDLSVFFKELPHNIQYWVVLLYSEDDKVFLYF